MNTYNSGTQLNPDELPAFQLWSLIIEMCKAGKKTAALRTVLRGKVNYKSGE